MFLLNRVRGTPAGLLNRVMLMIRRRLRVTFDPIIKVAATGYVRGQTVGSFVWKRLGNFAGRKTSCFAYMGIFHGSQAVLSVSSAPKRLGNPLHNLSIQSSPITGFWRLAMLQLGPWGINWTWLL